MTVLIVPDEDVFFAQGVEEDYGAQGNTVEEAKANFLLGRRLTKEARMRHFGCDVIEPAPAALVDEFRNTPGVVVVEVE